MTDFVIVIDCWSFFFLNALIFKRNDARLIKSATRKTTISYFLYEDKVITLKNFVIVLKR